MLLHLSMTMVHLDTSGQCSLTLAPTLRLDNSAPRDVRPTWKTEICCRCAPLVEEALRRPTSELPALAGFLPARMSFSRFSVACAASSKP
jgi:hypothetical protein